MTAYCTDPASEAVTVVMDSLRTLYAPGSDCPPLGGATSQVAFFAGDIAPIDEVNCESPVLWVRLVSRHRSAIFPEPSVITMPCGALDVIVVELGVARCADMDPTPASQAAEAEVALDDTWRLSKAMCLAASELGKDHHVGSDVITPYGPEGGVIAWTTNIYISV